MFLPVPCSHVQRVGNIVGVGTCFVVTSTTNSAIPKRYRHRSGSASRPATRLAGRRLPARSPPTLPLPASQVGTAASRSGSSLAPPPAGGAQGPVRSRRQDDQGPGLDVDPPAGSGGRDLTTGCVRGSTASFGDRTAGIPGARPSATRAPGAEGGHVDPVGAVGAAIAAGVVLRQVDHEVVAVGGVAHP